MSFRWCIHVLVMMLSASAFGGWAPFTSESEALDYGYAAGRTLGTTMIAAYEAVAHVHVAQVQQHLEQNTATFNRFLDRVYRLKKYALINGITRLPQREVLLRAAEGAHAMLGAYELPRWCDSEQAACIEQLRQHDREKLGVWIDHLREKIGAHSSALEEDDPADQINANYAPVAY